MKTRPNITQRYPPTLGANERRRMCGRALAKVGGGYSYTTAVSKVAAEQKLGTGDMLALAQDVFTAARKRGQLTRAQAHEQLRAMLGVRG